MVLITRKLKKREKDACAQQRKERKNGEKMYHRYSPPPPRFFHVTCRAVRVRESRSLSPPPLTI